MVDEQIAAAYISAAKSFGTKWSAKIGLRGEYTYARGDWRSAGEKSVKSYFNLFPTVFVSYMPTQKWRLAASYTRRISRPGYSQLNPFRTYISANAFTEGDPDLDPQFSDQVSLTVGYGQHLNLSLLYQHNSNLIMQRPEVNQDNGGQRLIWENFGTQSLAGAALSISELPIAKWLNLSANYFAAYNGNTSSGGSYSDGSFVQSFYGNLNFLLPKEWKIEAGGMATGNMTVGYMNIRPMYMLFAGIKKNLWDGRGTIALNVQDAHQHAESHPLVQLALRNGHKRPQAQCRQRRGILPRRRLHRHKYRTDIEVTWEIRISDSDSSPYGTTGAR